MRRFATGTAVLLRLTIGLVAMPLLALVVAKPPSGGVLATPTDRDHRLAAHYFHHRHPAEFVWRLGSRDGTLVVEIVRTQYGPLPMSAIQNLARRGTRSLPTPTSGRAHVAPQSP